MPARRIPPPSPAPAELPWILLPMTFTLPAPGVRAPDSQGLVATDEDAAARDRLALVEVLVEDDGVVLDQRGLGEHPHSLALRSAVSGCVTQVPSLTPVWPMPPPLPSEKLPHTQFSVIAYESAPVHIEMPPPVPPWPPLKTTWL